MKYFSFALLLCLFACQSDPKTAPNADVFKKIFVNSQKVLCKGVATQFCLQIRDSSEQNWHLWYEPIKDFNYEEGFNYELKVIEKKVENPAPNTAPIKYIFVREIRKTHDKMMSLKTTQDIDTWFTTTYKGLENVEPVNKEITFENKKINAAIYAQNDKPTLIRSTHADGTISEYYLYKTEVLMMRELIPGMKPIENRFYFHDKAFLEALTRQSVGKMAMDGIAFTPLEPKSGKEDFRFKFNSVMQEAYAIYGTK
jgi:hypothetical protein